MIRRVLFVSQATVIVNRYEMMEFCRRAHDRNRLAGVTGVLMSGAGHFMEALEGQHATVESTIRRVLSDQRHAGISFLIDDTVNERLFQRWRLAAWFGHDPAAFDLDSVYRAATTLPRVGQKPVASIEGIRPLMQAFLEQIRNDDRGAQKAAERSRRAA